MSTDISVNYLGQPFGKKLPDWKSSKFPETKPIVGNSCRLEVLTHDHAFDLWSANCIDVEKKNWNYLPYGPYDDFVTYENWVKSVAGKSDPMYFAIVDLETEKPVGVSAYTFIAPEMGSIEIGQLNFSPLMQRSIKSTETIFLMIENAFSNGFRRVVWRSHSLNAASISAANRFGFKFECFYKNYSVMKGRNRDNVWFSIVEEDWPALHKVYENWMKLALQGNHQSLRTMINQHSGKFDKSTFDVPQN
jgi:RimJ/RimL family protein N-acetyltransferase